MKNSVVFCLIAVGVFLVGVASPKVLPKYIHICKASNPLYNECLLKTIESVRPRLAKGIPKLRLPPLEPFVVSHFDISTNEESLRGRLTIKDGQIHGISNFIINSLKADPVTLTSKMSVTYPVLSGSGSYDVDGRIMTVSLKNKGLATFNCTNVKAEFQTWGKIATTNGVNHLFLDRIDAKVRVLGDLKLKLVSNEPKTKGLTDTFNLFFHENRRDILELVYPLMDQTMNDFGKQMFNMLVETIPIEEIRPH